MKFVPNCNLILGQSGSSISLYKWDLLEDLAERILIFEDPLISPLLPAIVVHERLVVFTELGVALYSLEQLLSKGLEAHFAPLDELYFNRDDQSNSPSSLAGANDGLLSIDW